MQEQINTQYIIYSCAFVGAGSVCKLFGFNLAAPNCMQNDHELDLGRAVVLYHTSKGDTKKNNGSPIYSPQ